MRYFIFISLLFISTTESFSDSLGTNKTINDYLDNGYLIQSIQIMDEEKLLYNLLNNGSEEKMFEPRLISCVYDINSQISDCFKP